MKKRFIPLFLIPVFAYTLYFVVFSGKIAPRHPFEKSEWVNEENKKIAIGDFKGQVLIVTYFQSWCGDCRRELQELEVLQKHFDEQLKVLVITDEPFEISNQVKEYLKTDLPFFKSEKALKETGIHRFPTTYLLDKSGKVVMVKVEAAHWNTAEIKSEIVKLNK